MIKKVAIAISINVPAASAIIWSPANYPADVRFVMEMSVTSGHDKKFDPAMPNEKDTAKYPSPIGEPSFKPFK